MNVLEKILEEIREIEKKYVVGHNVLFALGATGMATEISSIICSHMDDVSKRGECSRRKWYQMGYEDGKKNDGWIPVSERLPEESDYYMACIYNDEADDYDFRKTWFAHADDYDMDESEWRELYDFERVIAWQPLPEPYKEG